MEEFQCPNCGFELPEFDGTFYKIENGELIFNLCIEDLKETELPQPEEYYPKFLNTIIFHTDVQKLISWDEIHKCPKCNKEFKISCDN